MKTEKIPTPFSLKQLQRLFSVLDNPKISLACFLALRTGMRRFEVISTKISEIEWELKRINKPITKGGKPRTYYLDTATLKILKKWISTLPDTEYLFPSLRDTKKHMSPTGFFGEFKKYLKLSGLWVVDKNRGEKNDMHVYNFHTFRTTFCSLLINSGVSVFTAKSLMGHSKITTTERHYAYMGDITLKHELDRVFSKNRNKAYSQLQQAGDTELKPIEEKPVQESPMDALQRKLVNDEISLEEFNRKANAILSVSSN